MDTTTVDTATTEAPADTQSAPTLEPTVSASTTNTDAEADLTPTPTSTVSETSKLEEQDTFYMGALKRTGTLYEGAKEGVLKRSGTVTEAFNGGLKRTGTLIGDAREGFVQQTEKFRESAGQGLQRAGTVLEPYRQGMMKRTGTITENASVGLQRTGTILASARDVTMQRANSFGLWAQDYAKGIYDPDRPFKATFQQVPGVFLQRTGHTLSVINGRAYIFGGEDETGVLADNHMHVVILPSGGVLEADYRSIAPRSLQKNGELPGARKGHTAAIVEDIIYIFGGQLSEKSKQEEPGRVWAFDTISARWSFQDPKPDAPYPAPRTLHSAVTSDLPGREQPPSNPVETPKRNYLNPSLQPATPEPLPSDSWGTMFIYGGANPVDETALNDVWAFDIASGTWFAVPPPPGPARPGASLVLVNNGHLYRVGGRTDPEHILEVDYIDMSELLQRPFRNRIFLHSLQREWKAMPLSAPLLSPSLHITDPGDGRNILVSIQPGAKTVTAVDLSPDVGMVLLGGTTEMEESDEMKARKQVEAVQVQYADAYGEIIRGSTVGMRTFVQASGWACSEGTSVEEAGLVIWGGKDAEGKTLGSGWLIKVEQ